MRAPITLTAVMLIGGSIAAHGPALATQRT